MNQIHFPTSKDFFFHSKKTTTKPFFSSPLPGQSNVFIHVEGDDVLEGELASLVELDEVSVDTDGGGTGGETQDEGLGSSGGELLDALLDVLGYVIDTKRVSQQIQDGGKEIICSFC